MPVDHRLSLLLAVAFGAAILVPMRVSLADSGEPVGHLLISEVLTGGVSASDEFVELYNPSPVELSLEGLELVYVTASGATVTRKAEWLTAAPAVPPGHHVLAANEAGIFSSIADALYAGGLAASGGSLVLRRNGGETAVDAVGWGTAASSWLEGIPAEAAPAGSSLERLPGGASGSTQDTDDNVVDFIVREMPDPQNSTSTPTPSHAPSPSPTATPTIGPTGTAEPTPMPTPMPTASPAAAISIAEARAMPDDTVVLVSGLSLTGSAFSEGGGYLADATGGIAVLLDAGAFDRGAGLLVAGVVDDRFAQRTIRASGDGIAPIGGPPAPAPALIATGDVGEAHEGRLVVTSGLVTGSPTALSGGLAFDLDDGSGSLRVVVYASTGIATDAWRVGAELELVGVIGQRDSSGAGTGGYRLQPRDTSDVLAIRPPAATPSPSVSGLPTPTPAGQPTLRPTPAIDRGPLASIAEARAAAAGTGLRIRGVVTLGTGLVDPATAVIQDPSGAIVLRLSGEAGTLRRGKLVEVNGTRSTLGGMLTLRVADPIDRLGTATEPAPVARTTGGIGEADEALPVIVRGIVVTAARRSTAGNVFLTVDDGSGPLSVFLFDPSGVSVEQLRRGAWVEARGIVGQETTGSEPDRGYRIWPRDGGELRLLASATAEGARAAFAGAPDADANGGSSLEADASPGLAALLPGAAVAPGRDGVRATLVAGPWSELGLAGVLWDGERAMGIAEDAHAVKLTSELLGRAGPPAPVRVAAGPAGTQHRDLALPLLALPPGSRLERVAGPVADPLTEFPELHEQAGAAWVRISGRLAGGDTPRIQTPDGPVRIEIRCDAAPATDAPSQLAEGASVVTEGLADGLTARLVVGCDGLHLAPALVVGEPATGTFLPQAAPADGESAPDDVPRGGNELPALLLLAGGLLGLGVGSTVSWRTGLLGRIAGRIAGSDPPPSG